PQHTSALQGQGWVDELLNGNPARIYNSLGLHKQVFRCLCHMLAVKAGLRHSKYVSLEEQVAMFL
ncbi:hypothetical protein CALCODRAFT_416336, partial [Calocera cornea HHB12733]